jgi:hypothetical protein
MDRFLQGTWDKEKMHNQKKILLLIIICGLVLRLTGNTYGLPYFFGGDENKKVSTALNMENNSFSHDFRHPSFLYNSLFILFKLSTPFRPFLEKALPFGEVLQTENVFYLWLARCWMALLGTIAIYLVYLLGRKVKDDITGLFAALLFSITPLMAVSAHYTKEDTPLVFGVCLALLAIVKLSENRATQYYIYAGLACGLAFGIKFQGAALFLLIIFVHFLPEFDPRRREKDFLRKGVSKAGLKKMSIAFGAFITGFFLSSPVLIFNIPELIDGMNYQVNYIASGHHDKIAISALDYFFSFYLIKSIIPGLNIFIFLLSVAGAWLLYKEERRKTLILLLWFFGYYLSAEISLAKPYPFYSRYILPVIPVLCIFAGFSFAKSIPVIKNPSRQWVKLLLGFGLSLMIAYPLYLSTRYVLSMNPDTRLIAREWIIRHIPADAVLYEDGFRIKERFCMSLDPESYEEIKSKPDVVYFIISSHKFARYLEHPKAVPGQTAMYQEIITQCHLIKEFTPSFRSYGFNNPAIAIYSNRRE